MLLAALTAVPFIHAHAQGTRTESGPASATRDPGDPAATVPAARYTSAFGRYRPNVEAEVGAWRESNDTVARIGGWRIYGREAIAGPSGTEAAASGQAKPGPASPKPAHGHQR